MAMKNKNKNKKGYAKGGLVEDGTSMVVKRDFMGKHHSKFTGKDGYLVGGVDVEMSNPQETQTDVVQGQGNILSEKKRSAKWY